jgi:hypothetical protein
MKCAVREGLSFDVATVISFFCVCVVCGGVFDGLVDFDVEIQNRLLLGVTRCRRLVLA